MNRIDEEVDKQVGGWSTRFLRVKGTGPPVVLVHGVTDSADAWRPVLEELRLVGQQAVAVDLPSHGYASQLAPDRPALPQLRQFLMSVVASEAPLGGAVVVGNSLGGLVSLLTASDQRIDTTIALAPAGITPLPFERELTALLRPSRVLESVPVLGAARRRALRLIPPLLAPNPPGPAFLFPLSSISTAAVARGFTEAVSQIALVHRAAMSPDAHERYEAHLRRRGVAAALLSLVVRLADEATGGQVEFAKPAGNVVGIWGGQDTLCRPEGAELLAEQIPDAEVDVWPGVGHIVQLEVPDRVADAILQRCRNDIQQEVC